MEKLTLKIRKIGNSKGIVIPQKFLKQIETDTDEVHIEVDDTGILLKSNSEPVRKRWDRMFQKMKKNSDDQLLVPDVFKDDKLDAWK